jgi:hypothetical protein
MNEHTGIGTAPVKVIELNSIDELLECQYELARAFIVCNDDRKVIINKFYEEVRDLLVNMMPMIND